MDLKEATNITRSLMECVETLLQCSDGRIVLWTEDMDMQLALDDMDAEGLRVVVGAMEKQLKVR